MNLDFLPVPKFGIQNPLEGSVVFDQDNFLESHTHVIRDTGSEYQGTSSNANLQKCQKAIPPVVSKASLTVQGKVIRQVGLNETPPT